MGNMYGRGSAGYDNQYNRIQEDYIPGGGAYDDYAMNGQRQNSVEDDEIYSRDDPVANDDIDEGTRPGVMPGDEESGDEQNAGDEMTLQDDDEEEDEDLEHGDDGNERSEQQADLAPVWFCKIGETMWLVDDVVIILSIDQISAGCCCRDKNKLEITAILRIFCLYEFFVFGLFICGENPFPQPFCIIFVR